MRTSLTAFMAALSLATPSLAQPALQDDAPRELAPDPAQASSPAAEGTQTTSAEQGGDLYCRRKLGTWFYCDKPKPLPRSAAPAPAPSRQSAAEQMKAAMGAYFAGHFLTIKIEGGEVTESNMTIADDKKSAENKIAFTDILAGTAKLPPELYAIEFVFLAS